MKLILPTLMYLLLATAVMAQEPSLVDSDEEARERVQYTLFLPEEKTPELIKPEENNPFEAAADQNEKEGDT